MATTTNQVIWWVLFGAMFLYAGLAFAITGGDPSGAFASAKLLAVILGVMSVTTGGATLLIRSRALAGPIQSGDLDPRTPEGLQRAFVPYLLCMVLVESIGIYGLVLAFLARDPLYALPFVGAALVMLFLHRPTAADLQPPLGGPTGHLDPSPIS